MPLNRDAFLSKKGRQYKTLNVPEFGEVRIQSMTTSERANFETSLTDKNGKQIRSVVKTMRERMIIAHVVDESNKLMFTLDDIEEISQIPAGPIDMIYDACKRHSRFTDDGNFEDLEGNSEETVDA